MLVMEMLLAFPQQSTMSLSLLLEQFGTEIAALDPAWHVFFVKNSASQWHQQQELTASDAAADDWFGVLVAVRTERVIVGNHKESARAHELNKAVGSWIETHAFRREGVGAGFGSTHHVACNAIVVGAPEDDSAKGSTSAYNPSVARERAEVARLNAADGAPGDKFGFSLAMSRQSTVVGAPMADVDGLDKFGAACIISFNVTGQRGELTRLPISDGKAQDHFGRRVAVDEAALVALKMDRAGHIYEQSATTDTWEFAQMAPFFSRGGGATAPSLVGVSDGAVVISNQKADPHFDAAGPCCDHGALQE